MRRWWSREWRFFVAALSFLTRLPTPQLAGFETRWLVRSTAYYPLVGLIVGLLSAGVYRLAGMVWPPVLSSLLAVVTAAWITGGLHEDGWADLFDALGAGGDRERMLSVMKDSRIGATGALALILLISGKLTALAALPATEAPAALIVVHSLSRWASLPLLWRLQPARPMEGLASPLAGQVTWSRVATGTAIAVLISALSLGWTALLPGLVTVGLTAVSGWFFHRRLGGVTGDCLGATHQLIELAVLLVLAARWPFLR